MNAGHYFKDVREYKLKNLKLACFFFHFTEADVKTKRQLSASQSSLLLSKSPRQIYHKFLTIHTLPVCLKIIIHLVSILDFCMILSLSNIRSTIQLHPSCVKDFPGSFVIVFGI